jgi:probable F420-dependent oxidoreductase
VTAASPRSVGLVVPTNEPGAADLLHDLPARAERWGYDSLWVTDHVVGVRAMRGVYGDYWLDALTALTWIAATTKHVRLGTGVLVVPHRSPVLAAKMAATLDILSGGRLDLGVGTGWSRVEFRALGMEQLYEPRGRVTNEALEVMRACWSGGQVDFSGDFFAFRHISFEPTSWQKPHPPLWVGGHSGPALRRAARFADMWHPHDISPAELARIGDRLDEMAGRLVPRSVRIHVSEADLPGLADMVDAYREAACTQVVLDFRSQPCDLVTRLAERTAELLSLDPSPATDRALSPR